jgi:acyl dehydratase
MASTLDPDLVGKPGEPSSFTYAWKDAVLYALGVGAKRSELDYLYEGRGPKVLPSFCVVPMFQPMLERIVKTRANLAMIVHGAQTFRLHADLPSSGTLTTVARVAGLYDMRKFAIIDVDTDIRAGETKLAETRSQIIVRGAGGFGGEPPPKEPKVAEIPKDRPCDFRIEEVTSQEQALLYRLSGDLNPLHADPTFAASVGFEQGPILHGLCTLGYGVRHAGTRGRVTGFGVTFRKPVWPGETLITEAWDVAPGMLALSMKVKERDETVCTNGWAAYARSASA